MSDATPAPVAAAHDAGPSPGRRRMAVLYVMYEEYDFLAREIELLNRQTFLDFTFVCVSGHQCDTARVESILQTARFATEHLRRTADTGPAGGFHEGQTWCLAQGFGVIVHVESDCFPMGDDLMARLSVSSERSPVVVPVCVPDGIPMGWRWCAVHREVLQSVGLSYKDLYFLTEDVYFYRNVTRRFPPEILHDVTVYHAPVIEKHTFTDRFLAAFPYLWSRNHVLFAAMIVRTHGNWRDAVNFCGYFVALVTYATHLALRGKQASSRSMFAGITDGLLFREASVRKDRIEQTDPDYRVHEVSSFTADQVLDKQGFDIGPGTVLQALFSAGRRVLMKRPSTLTLQLVFALSSALAITDGQRYWSLKENAVETAADRVALYLVIVLAIAASPLALLFALIRSLGSHATAVPHFPPPAPRPTA